jgi:hypothetical protein
MFPLPQTSSLILRVDPALPTSVKFVRQYRAKKVIYDVEMYTAGASQAIRDAFGLFWRKKSGKHLPPELKGISFTNATTFSTRVRLGLLKELCCRHQLSNPNLSCYVTRYLARPELKIRDRKGMVTSLTYIQAVQQLPHHFTLSFLRDLYQYPRTNLPEKEVIERFLVLTPDLLLGVPPEQLSMSMDVIPSSQNEVVQLPSAQVPTGLQSITPAPTNTGMPSMSVPPPPIQGSSVNFSAGVSSQSQLNAVSAIPTFHSILPSANTITYASVTAPPQALGGEQSQFSTVSAIPTFHSILPPPRQYCYICSCHSTSTSTRRGAGCTLHYLNPGPQPSLWPAQSQW